MKMQQEIPASQFKMHCLALMDQVQQSGRELVITKRGKPVAKLVPADSTSKAIDELMEFRRTMPKIPLKELLEGRHKGHKY
jgi:prevent-host-death family protein